MSDSTQMAYFNLNADLYPVTSATVGFNTRTQALPPVNEEASGHLMGDTWAGVTAPPSPTVGFTMNQTDLGEHRGHRLVDFGLTHGLLRRDPARRLRSNIIRIPRLAVPPRGPRADRALKLGRVSDRTNGA